MTTKIGSQQKQSPEKGIPEGGPIPLHRDTTRIRSGNRAKLTRIVAVFIRACVGAPRNGADAIYLGVYIYICIYAYMHIYLCVFVCIDLYIV